LAKLLANYTAGTARISTHLVGFWPQNHQISTVLLLAQTYQRVSLALPSQLLDAAGTALQCNGTILIYLIPFIITLAASSNYTTTTCSSSPQYSH